MKEYWKGVCLGFGIGVSLTLIGFVFGIGLGVILNG